MSKEKIKLSRRIAHWFTYHPWLKLVSLALAVMLWIYVSSEMKRFN